MPSKLLWEPTDSTRIKLVGFYAYSNGDIGVNQDRHTGSYGSSAQVPLPGYPNPPIVLPSLGDVPGDNFYNNRLTFQPNVREEGYGASLRIDQEMAFADLVSITAFRNSKGQIRTDSDFSAQDFYNADLNNVDNQITQEFQIKSKSASSIDWIVGLYYLYSKAGYDRVHAFGDLLSVAVAPGAVQNIYGIQKINSYSIFGQATVPLAERTNVTAGLRYTTDRVSGVGYQTATIPGLAGEINLGLDFSQSKTFKEATWKLAVDHKFANDFMVFASYSRGYKAGTFKTLPLDQPPARPELVDAFEVGFKSELLDRRVRLNGAVFWNEIKDPQVTTFISQGVAAGQGLTNAQKARVKGAELAFEALAADGLNLRGAVTYLDGKYRKFTDAPFFSLNGSFLTGPVRGDASGFRLPNVPKWRLGGGINYTLDSGIGKWVADVSASYTGRFAWNADNRIFEKAVTLLNASLDFTPSSLENVTLGVWGQNLGGVKYYAISQEFAGPFGVGGDQASPAPPRTYGVRVSVKY